MVTSWRDGREVFARLLRQHGADPDHVGSVAAAWDAFQDFAQVELAGVEPGEDGEALGIGWGVSSWNDELPALYFARHLAVIDLGNRDDEFWQPQYWSVDLELLFAEHPSWEGLNEMAWRGSEAYYAPIGSARAASLTEAAEYARSFPQVAALWQATPIRSNLSLERAD